MRQAGRYMSEYRAVREEADRIIDQASENLHREAMHTRETRDAVEQLAMLGVSAAQIAKRVALPRATVDAALNVTRNPATKDRMDATGMTLEEAAIFAEFEDDPDAIDTLTTAWEDSWRRRQIPHIVQRLRDECRPASRPVLPHRSGVGCLRRRGHCHQDRLLVTRFHSRGRIPPDGR